MRCAAKLIKEITQKGLYDTDLDVSMNDSAPVTVEHRLDDLPEEVPGERLGQPPLARDVVEEVLTRLGPLHDQDEGVGALEQVEQADHARHVGHLLQEDDLERDAAAVQLERGQKRLINRRLARAMQETPRVEEAELSRARYVAENFDGQSAFRLTKGFSPTYVCTDVVRGVVNTYDVTQSGMLNTCFIIDE